MIRIPMLPANTTGRDNIDIEYVITAPVASVPLRPKNSEKNRVDGKISTINEPKTTKFSDFPILEGFA